MEGQDAGRGIAELIARARELLGVRRAHYGQLEMEPFELEVELASPVVLDVFSVHLDGILALAVLKDISMPTPDMNYFTEPLDIPLPLEWRGKFWAASALWMPDPAQGTLYWRKRWDEKYERWVQKRRKINTGSGTFRSYNMPMQTYSAPRASFYGVGNLKEVLRLLKRRIYYIGKKGSQGNGMVKRWSIRPAEKDMSAFLEWPGGKVITMRALPTEWIMRQGYIPLQSITLGIRPPYWYSDNWDTGALPFTEVKPRGVDS